MGMVRQVPLSGSGKRREQGGCGAEGQHHRVPAMGRGTGLGKRRGRGDRMGAEDGEVWPGRVRNGAAKMEWITYLLISSFTNNVLIIFVPQILLKITKTHGNLTADEHF
jgi:hypothetical protein